VFFSSQPTGASVYIDGKTSKTTDTRLQMQDGTYNVKLQKAGYRPWQRVVKVDGGSVQHFDYPFLFPTQLITTTVKTASAASPLATQSPDRRWLLTADSNFLNGFTEYDLNSPKQPLVNVTVPASLLTKPAETDTYSLVEWSTDNIHVLLQHTYDGGQEYILLNRQSPDTSVNLTTTLKLSASAVVSLRNKANDQYFILDSADQTLSTATINDPSLVTYLPHVLAFKSYGSDTVLYATSEGATAGKTLISLRQNGNIYPIKEVSPAPPYLLNLTKYSGDLFVAAGASGDGKVYIYKNPASIQLSIGSKVLVSNAVLRVDQANYVSFSNSAQYIMVEKSNQFAIYDAETAKQYNYTTTQPIDAPQAHATWMDGNRLEYVSGSKLAVMDYDYTNVQVLMPASPTAYVFYDQNYKFVYALTAGKTAPTESLTSTALQVP
jgi:hypothetical protein